MSASISKSKALTVLGLADGASDLEVKEAYRKLARLHHPDIDQNGAEKMASINEAYERLTRYNQEPDPIERVTLTEEDPWADFDDD